MHGRKDGSGKLHNVDGSFYDGNWTNGMKCGKGVNYYSNGDRYQGDWFHNKRHGRGRYEFKKTGKGTKLTGLFSVLNSPERAVLLSWYF